MSRVPISAECCPGASGPWAGEFSFHSMPAVELPAFKSEAARLEKWNISQTSRISKFRYDQYFSPKESGVENFALSLWNSSAFQESFKLLDSRGSWVSPTTRKSLVVEHVPSTVTNLTFFDVLYECGVLRENGSICKCLDDVVDGVMIADELRKMLVDADSEHYDLFTERNRSEFIFRLFSTLVLGGPLCQYEDDIKPYFESTKALYKDFVRVSKNSATNELEVSSMVYEIKSSDLFPNNSKFSHMMLIVDDVRRHVTCWYFSRPASWC